MWQRPPVNQSYISIKPQGTRVKKIFNIGGTLCTWHTSYRKLHNGQRCMHYHYNGLLYHYQRYVYYGRSLKYLINTYSEIRFYTSKPIVPTEFYANKKVRTSWFRFHMVLSTRICLKLQKQNHLANKYHTVIYNILT